MTAYLPAFAPAAPRLAAVQRSALGLCAMADCETPPEDHVRAGALGWLWFCEPHAKMWRRQP